MPPIRGAQGGSRGGRKTSAVDPNTDRVPDAHPSGVRKAVGGSPQGRPSRLTDDEPSRVREGGREPFSGAKKFYCGASGGAGNQEITWHEGEVGRRVGLIGPEGVPGATVHVRRVPVLGGKAIEVLRRQGRRLRPSADLVGRYREEEGVELSAYEAGGGGDGDGPLLEDGAGIHPCPRAATHELCGKSAGSYCSRSGRQRVRQ